MATKPMRIWRLTRTGQTALDGAGMSEHGGRYSPPGAPVVNFASEAGLAVLVALRYLPGDPADAPDDYVLGWTEIDANPESVRDADGDAAIRDWVTDWLEERRSQAGSDLDGISNHRRLLSSQAARKPGCLQERERTSCRRRRSGPRRSCRLGCCRS
jgi:RES domain-containing protein